MTTLHLMAEKVGFEPTRRFTAYTISSRAPSTKLGDFSTPERLPDNERDFNTFPFGSQGINHSFFIVRFHCSKRRAKGEKN